MTNTNEARTDKATIVLIHGLWMTPSSWVTWAARFRAAGLAWREFLIPGTTLWQLFVYDPSGVQCELTFEGATESGPPPDMSPGRAYVAGSSFFDAADYPKLTA